MALQIIGAGFGRTGTLSLKTALEQLGFPCYHMLECFPQGPSHWKLWEQAMQGHPNWEALFEGFTATVDFPASTSYKALADHYPDAKVILTVRNPEKWFQSTQDTIFSPHWMEFQPTSEAGAFLQATIYDYFDSRMHDHDHLIRRFQEHIDEVNSSIPADRLLVFEVAQGWKPLCDFLGLEAPNTAFPHVNDTEALKEMINAIIEHGFQSVLGYEG